MPWRRARAFAPRRLLACLGLCSLVRCSSPLSPAAHVAGCPDGTPVEVTAGTAPRFTWGGCSVAALGVEPVDSQGAAVGSPVWLVEGEGDADGVPNNVIESGVTYGQEPKLATTRLGPMSLQPGQRYRVYIGMTGLGPASRLVFEGIGEGFFIP